MKLRHKFTIYLVATHLLFGAVALRVLLDHRAWLLAIEGAFLVSLLIGMKLIRDLFRAVDLIDTGPQFIHDGDFTTRFRETGHPEIDRVIGIYNRMADHLREERTRQQEQNLFLEKVLTASPAGIITFDFDGRVAMINPAASRFLQLNPEKVSGRRLEEAGNQFATALAAIGLDASGVIQISGRRRLKCRRSQFLDRGFSRDFLLMDELTEELRQAEKNAYEKVIRLMSHEVNNSIGSANSLLHSCLHYSGQLNAEDREDFENALRVIISRTEHLSDFMRRFADVFRLPPPNPREIDLNAMIEELALLYRSECKQRRIDLRIEAEPSIQSILADRSQLEQVTLNIIKNSIEAIESDGAITIVTGRRNNHPFLSIRDTGRGFSETIRTNLFTPFFSTKENGQGIGLTMIQEILEQHGFEFSFESRPGSETEFRIVFNSRR